MKMGEAFLELMPKLSSTYASSVEAEAQKAGTKSGEAMASSMSKAVATSGKAVAQAASTVTAAAATAAATEGDKAGKGFAQRLKDGLNAAKSDVSMVGSSMALGLTAAFSGDINLREVNQQIQRQLGTTEQEAAKLGLVAGKLYSDGLADGMDEITTAIGDVISEIDGIKDQGLPAIQAVTQGALGIAKTFDQDVSQVVRSVGQLMKTGLAKDSQEALDLIASGFQKIPSAADDLLDTVTEYSVQFKKLGLDGKDALGLIQQMVEGGARNTDLAADALKEFSIRAIDASGAVQDAFREIGLDADEVQRKFGEGGKVAREAFGDVVDRLNKIEDPLKRNAAGVELFGTQWEDLGDAFRRVDLRTAADGLGEIEGAADRVANNDFADRFRNNMEKVKGAMTVIGGGLGLSFATSIGDAIDLTASNEKIARELGLSKEAAEELGKAAGNVYSKGLGESLGEVNEAISTVIKTIPGIKDAGVPTIEAVTEGALKLSKKFDQDLGGTTQAVAQLMKTGLAKNATEALDLITTGLGKIPRAGEDLIDTTNEYAVQFQKLGLSGQDAMGLIKQLMEGGARDTDIAADAIKEFSIRAIEDSDGVKGAFKSLGFDAKELQAQFAKGGPEARAAFGQVIDALNAVEDPLKKNTLGVELFGTQWEDLGGAFKKADLDTAAASLGKIEGANKAIKDSDPRAVIDQFTRSIQTGFVEILGKHVVPIMVKFAKYLNEHPTIFKGAAIAVGLLVAAYLALNAAMAVMAAGGVITFIKGVITSTKAWTVAQWAMNAALTANPIGLVVAAVAALVAGLVIAYKNSETFRKVVDAAWAGIKKAAQATWDNYLKPALGHIVDALKKTGEGFTWLWKNAVVPAWDGIKKAIDTVWGWMKTTYSALETAVKAVGKVFEWLWKNAIEPAWKGIQLAIEVAKKAVELYFKAIEIALRALGKVFEWLWKNVVVPVWDGIKAHINAVWTAVKAIWDTIIKFLQTTFKAAWDAYSALVKATWEAIKQTIQTIWNFIRDSIFTPIITYLKTTFTNAWNAFRDMLKALWEAIKQAIQTTWNFIRDQIFTPIVTYLKTTFTNAWNAFKTMLTTLWDNIKTMLKTAWDWIKTNVFTPIVNYLAGAFKQAWESHKKMLTDLWNAIKEMLKAAWNWIRDNVFKPIADHLGGPLKQAWDTAKKNITAAWEGIKQPIQATWDWVRTNVFDKLSEAIRVTIPNAFNTGVSAIKTAWEKVKQAASDPVKFVVNTVLNNGIIKGFNWVAEKVGAGKIEPISLGFASGGVLPGYTPGKDVHRFIGPAGTLDLSGGEAIMRPEWTRVMGRHWVHAANAAARGGGTSGIRRFMQRFMNGGKHNARFASGGIYEGKYADGGIVDRIKGAWDAVTDPVGTFKSAVNGLMGGMPGGPWMKDMLGKAVSKLVDSVAEWIRTKFESMKAAMGDGTTPKGWEAMWNWVKGKFPNASLYSGVRPGSTTLSGNTSYHASGRAIDVNPDKAISDAIIKAFGKNITELISPWKSDHVWHGQRPYDYGYAIDAQHGVYGNNAHIHWAQMAKGGIFKYDNGGMLYPGQLGVNLLRKPEAVLTPEETRGLKALGADKIEELLEELIEAVKEVAPGVGQTIRGVGKSVISKGRAV